MPYYDYDHLLSKTLKVFPINNLEYLYWLTNTIGGGLVVFSFGKFLDRKSHLPKQLSYPLTKIRISTFSFYKWGIFYKDFKYFYVQSIDLSS